MAENSVNNNTGLALPGWYWSSGLHDAVITSFEEQVLEYDHTVSNPIRNCLSLKIDAKGALYDNTMKEIKLYNYKLITDLGVLNEYNWWLDDNLTKNGYCYTLQIRLELCRGRKETVFSVRFENAEVIRSELKPQYYKGIRVK